MQDPKLQDLSNPSLQLRMSYSPRQNPSTNNGNAKRKRAKQKDNELVEVVENEKKNYVVCHVSFQSTGGTNITSVNALSNAELCVCEQNTGREK